MGVPGMPGGNRADKIKKRGTYRVPRAVTQSNRIDSQLGPSSFTSESGPKSRYLGERPGNAVRFSRLPVSRS